jgi:hypothetical protein
MLRDAQVIWKKVVTVIIDCSPLDSAAELSRKFAKMQRIRHE